MTSTRPGGTTEVFTYLCSLPHDRQQSQRHSGPLIRGQSRMLCTYIARSPRGPVVLRWYLHLPALTTARFLAFPMLQAAQWGYDQWPKPQQCTAHCTDFHAYQRYYGGTYTSGQTRKQCSTLHDATRTPVVLQARSPPLPCLSQWWSSVRLRQLQFAVTSCI